MKQVTSSTFKRWLSSIKDTKTRARIVGRINRLIDGLPGDVKPVGRGLSELRLHFGAGYRVYYYQDQNVLILLLNGGDKSTQEKDIAKAYILFEQWRNQHD